MKTLHTSTMGSDKVTIIGGTISPAHKEVIQTSTQITIRNQPSLKDLVLGQAKINESLTKNLTYNDKMLENINTKIDGLSSSVKNQLSFIKMIETKCRCRK